MSDLRINGINVGGTIQELKKNVTLEAAYIKTQKDKVDQVYFKSEGKDYVAFGQGLNLKGLKKAALPNAKLDGKEAEIKFIDNEVNTATEGMKKVWKVAAGLAGGAVAGGGILAGMGMSMAASAGGGAVGTILGAFIGAGAIYGGIVVAAAGAIGGAATTAGGAIYGATRKANPEPTKSVVQ